MRTQTMKGGASEANARASARLIEIIARSPDPVVCAAYQHNVHGMFYLALKAVVVVVATPMPPPDTAFTTACAPAACLLLGGSKVVLPKDPEALGAVRELVTPPAVPALESDYLASPSPRGRRGSCWAPIFYIAR